MTIDRPMLPPRGEPAGELYYPTPVTPEEAFQAIGRLRKEARDEIDRLIRFLDETDNHLELEPDGDEFDLSYPESGPRVLNGPMSEDDEDSDTDEESDPAEASLGFLEHHPSPYGEGRDWIGNQERLCDGLNADLEDEHDGREEDDHGGDGAKEDDEPSLGWPERMNQAAGAGSQSGADRELQDHAPVKPQRRTRLGKGVHAAPNFCLGSRALGLTAAQQARFDKRRRAVWGGIF